jgi:methylenetetrahydrofolate reductase (NADPH)
MARALLLPHHLSRFQDFLSLPAPKVSFEFFPPKTEEGEASLWQTIHTLEDLNPSFVSVTYGAGGTTRDRTYKTVERILNETTLSPAAHLTCIGASRMEIDDLAWNYWEAGIKHIVALRGDVPVNEPSFTPHNDGYKYARELVEGLKKVADFEISVACFPEGHPESKDENEDLYHLKEKLDIGADRAISQYFFDTDVFLRFLDKAQAIGITQPIIPGIVLINNFKQLERFSAMCGATIPAWVYKMLDGLDETPELRQMISVMLAAEQCRILREAGIDQFHFYTLNRPALAQAVCKILGINAQKSLTTK